MGSVAFAFYTTLYYYQHLQQQMMYGVSVNYDNRFTHAVYNIL